MLNSIEIIEEDLLLTAINWFQFIWRWDILDTINKHNWINYKLYTVFKERKRTENLGITQWYCSDGLKMWNVMQFLSSSCYEATDVKYPGEIEMCQSVIRVSIISDRLIQPGTWHIDKLSLVIIIILHNTRTMLSQMLYYISILNLIVLRLNSPQP